MKKFMNGLAIGFLVCAALDILWPGPNDPVWATLFIGCALMGVER